LTNFQEIDDDSVVNVNKDDGDIFGNHLMKIFVGIKGQSFLIMK
jgi:hypothetical protein